jgi:hypothetical protein
VAQSADREDTGIHRRHSLTKIGAESEGFVDLFDAVTKTRVRTASRERERLRMEHGEMEGARRASVLSCSAKAGHPVITVDDCVYWIVRLRGR